MIVSKEELVLMFEDERIVDTGSGWFMGEEEVEIIAIHEVDPKFLQDIANAKSYKIITKGK